MDLDRASISCGLSLCWQINRCNCDRQVLSELNKHGHWHRDFDTAVFHCNLSPVDSSFLQVCERQLLCNKNGP